MSNRPGGRSYLTHYYCGECMLWYPHEDCVDYRCPDCSKQVRTVGRNLVSRDFNRYGKCEEVR